MPERHIQPVLCWGGPEHGNIHEVDVTVSPYRFNVDPPLTRVPKMPVEPVEEFGLPPGYVSYQVERITIHSKGYGEDGHKVLLGLWYVLAYLENLPSVMQNLIGTCNALLYLCTWKWAL